MHHETFKLFEPERSKYPLILSAPHSGTKFPSEFLSNSNLSEIELLMTADLGTDILLSYLSNITTISATYARSFIDLNRSRTQLDPALISGVPKSKDVQVNAGYGVLPRYADQKKLTQNGKIPINYAQELIKRYYEPYHGALKLLIEKQIESYGSHLLLDIHSAPAHLMNGADVVLGSRFGASCHPLTLQNLMNSIENQNLIVNVDIPFSGGYITQHYAKLPQIEVIQIEFSRAFFEKEDDGLAAQPSETFLTKWQNLITEFVKFLPTKLTHQDG